MSANLTFLTQLVQGSSLKFTYMRGNEGTKNIHKNPFKFTVKLVNKRFLHTFLFITGKTQNVLELQK